MVDSIAIGPPGVYFAPPSARRALVGEPMDVCAFVGVAPRGPAKVPVVDGTWTALHAGLDPARPRRRSVAVPVESMDAYHRLFGGYEGPGRLPYAVRTFFAQGGRRAWVVRIVPSGGGSDEGAAWLELPGLDAGGPVRLRARDEGRWGDRLSARIHWRVSPLPAGSIVEATVTSLTLWPDDEASAGSLLRLKTPGGVFLRHVVQAVPVGGDDADELRRLSLDQPLLAPPTQVDRIEADVEVSDGAGRRERWTGLGLDPRHPRWLARVLDTESSLVFADAAWFDHPLEPTDFEPLVPVMSAPASGGADRYHLLEPADFFDGDWTPVEGPGAGMQAIVAAPEVASLVVPDLYEPAPLDPTEDVGDPPSLAGATFAPCVDLPRDRVDGGAPPPARGLELLHLDPASPADLAAIIDLQIRQAAFAEEIGVIALLDVPPGLKPRQVRAWRRHFRSAWAAGYHGWLTMAVPEDGREGLVRINPSATAAGIIAQRELRHGVPWGPANALVVDGVGVDERLTPEQHGLLHHDGINVFALEPDGVRLTGARTLSTRRAWRQLSVRRLMTQLARTIERQMQWLSFEPNSPATRALVARTLRALLRTMFRASAFAGATEEEAFFVRCDDSLNSPYVIDAGRLVAEVGVAPVAPSEFLVVRLERTPDADLQVEA